MSTLRTMMARIQRELGRGSDDQVREAIVTALYEARREPHRISERRAARIETESGRVWYSTIGFPAWTAATAEKIEAARADRLEETEWSFDDLPREGRIEDLLQVDYVKVRRSSGEEWPLTGVSYERFAAHEANATTSSAPTAYTVYSQQIGVWPVPDGVYEIFISGLWRPYIPQPEYADSRQDDASSALLRQAEELIRNSAKRRYCVAVKDMAGAADFGALERASLDRLRAEDTIRNQDAIRPWGVC